MYRKVSTLSTSAVRVAGNTVCSGSVLIFQVHFNYAVLIVLLWATLTAGWIYMSFQKLIELHVIIYENLFPAQKTNIELLTIDIKHSVSYFWDAGAYLLAISQVVCVTIQPHLANGFLFLLIFCPIPDWWKEIIAWALVWSTKWLYLNIVNFAVVCSAFNVELNKLTLDIEIETKPALGGIYNACLPPFSIATVWLVLLAHLHRRGKLNPAELFETHVDEGNGPVHSAAVLLTAVAIMCFFFCMVEPIFEVKLEGLIPLFYSAKQKDTVWHLHDILHAVWSYFPSNDIILGFTFIAPIGSFITRLFALYYKSNFAFYLDLFVASYGALEVSSFAYIGNTLELAEFSQFLVDKQAPQLCDLVEDNLHLPCLRANGHIRPGMWWLTASSVCFCLSHLLPWLASVWKSGDATRNDGMIIGRRSSNHELLLGDDGTLKVPVEPRIVGVQ